MPSQDYKLILRSALDKILDSPGETYEPRGLFICSDEVDGETVYTAVNNLGGDAITEEFTNRRSAVRWLHGNPVSADQYWRPKSKEQKERERLTRLMGE